MGVIYHSTAGRSPLHAAAYGRRIAPGRIRHHPLVAYTFLLFVLLYVPCLATIVVIGRRPDGDGQDFPSHISSRSRGRFAFYTGGRLLGL